MEENLVALEAVLGPLHQQIVRASSGEEALKAMLRQDFAVVLLDVLMPGMDGFETAANIKRFDRTKDVPIILLTGTDTDYAYRGYAIGAADFSTKPFAPWVLRTKVSVFLDLDRKNRQLAVQAKQLQRLLASDRKPVEGAEPEERLVEIGEELAAIELQLRGTEGPDAAALADRTAKVRRTVNGLRVRHSA
ncbi:response regulator [Streptomyces wuyuanensis]|uniref:response regulator n=1 Tax=Streptomyces wuyuanensis TaxID=1196353 RepID=UPI003D724F3F